MVLKVNHQELGQIVKEYYDKKISLFIVGAFGIGKSFVVKDTAKELAKERAREFIEWNKINAEKKQEVYEYPEKYFVYIDERLAEYDGSDIKGLPNFKGNSEILEWKVPFWSKLLTKENTDGVVFFDELNLATPIVQSSVYKIIYDRMIGEEVVYKNWLLLGAGNREEDRGFTHSMAMPLRDRMGEIELITPSVESWTEWAMERGIDNRIIGFVNFKPSCLYKIDFNDEQKQTTTRGYERLSILIKDKPIDNIFKLLCCSAIGEGIAREFIAFSDLQSKFNLNDLIKNPSKLKDIKDISVKYLFLSSVSEKYALEDKNVDYAKIEEISKVLDKINNAEFVSLLWKFCYNYTKTTNKFVNDFTDKGDLEFIKKYGKYIR